MRELGMILTLAAIGVIGCGGEDAGVKLVPVLGTVSQNGQPLPNAMVSFVPSRANKDQTSTVDRTGPEGTYKLIWHHRTGVAPGHYTVTITPPFEALKGEEKLPSNVRSDPIMTQMMLYAKGISSGKIKDDKAAARGTRFTFEADVPEQGGTIDFDIKTAPTAAGRPKSG
jgi:hypothetical protein